MPKALFDNRLQHSRPNLINSVEDIFSDCFWAEERISRHHVYPVTRGAFPSISYRMTHRLVFQQTLIFPKVLSLGFICTEGSSKQLINHWKNNNADVKCLQLGRTKHINQKWATFDFSEPLSFLIFRQLVSKLFLSNTTSSNTSSFGMRPNRYGQVWQVWFPANRLFAW